MYLIIGSPEPEASELLLLRSIIDSYVEPFLSLHTYSKQQVVTCGNVQSTHESVCGIIENTKLCPNVSMRNDSEEMLLNQLSLLHPMLYLCAMR
jgi:hypothetical protein